MAQSDTAGGSGGATEELLATIRSGAEVPADLVRSAQELLAREGLEALQAVANKAMAATTEVPAPACPKGHDLTRQSPGMSDWISGVKCDACGGSAYSAGDMWSCRACDYDECGICAARLKCPKGHTLVKKGVGVMDWISGMTCDACKQNPWNSGSAWSCRECDYDQCGKCMADKSKSGKSTAPAPSALPGPTAAEPQPKPALPLASGKQSAPAAPTPTAKEAEPEDAKRKSESSGWFGGIFGGGKDDYDDDAPTNPEEDNAEAKDTSAPSPVAVTDGADAGTLQKARDEALARKRAIEERMAADQAALMEEEHRLNFFKNKLGEVDKVRQRSEALRSSIEQGKREIQRLEKEKETRKEGVKQAEETLERVVKQAEEAVRQAKAAQVACEAQLLAKREQCQQLEQEMVDFLLEEDSKEKNGEDSKEAAAEGSSVEVAGAETESPPMTSTVVAPKDITNEPGDNGALAQLSIPPPPPPPPPQE